MSFPRKNRSVNPGLEALEARIAPARLFQIGGSDAAETYAGAGSIFVDTAATFGTDQISAVVGKGEIAGPAVDAKTYYLKLGPGDALLIKDQSTGTYRPFITAPITRDLLDVSAAPRLSCNVVAFFVDVDRDGVVEENELTGLSLGTGAKVQVHGVVYGDVVGNYNDQFGKLGGQFEPLGQAAQLPENTISLFSAVGVRGSIISGGTVNGIQVTGSVGQILSGSAAQGYQYNFFYGGNRPGAQILDGGDTLQVSPGVRQAGTLIRGVSVGNLGTIAKAGDVGVNKTEFDRSDFVGLIRAGNGGDGGVGGGISGVVVLADTDGFTIQAGAGGNEGASGGRGGAGGSLSDIVVYGVNKGTVDPTLNSDFFFRAGGGGTSTVGAGGSGGSLSGILFGFEGVSAAKAKASTGVLSDSVLLQAGTGGSGVVGGAGGSIVNSKVISSPEAVLAPGVSGSIKISAGAGGLQTGTGSAAGTGGGIANLEVANPGSGPEHRDAVIEIRAGDGGDRIDPAARGGSGGSISKVKLAGFSVTLRAGDGKRGSVGGFGGSVSGITVAAGSITDGGQIAPFLGLEPEEVRITAGRGGDGEIGAGGGGGGVSGVIVRNADLSAFEINAGSGGNSKLGNGGAGGGVSGIAIIAEKATDREDFLGPSRALSAVVAINGGLGGRGGEGSNQRGGAGGGISGVDIQGSDLSLQLTAGAGGVGNFASPRGNGGFGGSISGVSFQSFNITDVEAVSAPTTAVLTAGVGGVSTGVGAAGFGGSVSQANLRVSGDITVAAGAGGNGPSTGVSGGGGWVWRLTALSTLEDVVISAGNAGSGGAAVAVAGGALDGPTSALRRGVNIRVEAAKTIRLTSGNGGDGGAGGLIRNVQALGVNGGSPAGVDSVLTGLGAIDVDATRAAASITVTAGNGSASASKSGAGGSILGFTGNVATRGMTALRAGDGGGSGMSTAVGGAGGSIVGVQIFGGGGGTAELRIDAGNGGNTRDGAAGGAGGSVTDVVVDDLAADTFFRRIAAGDGGNSSSGAVGGNGGSVARVTVVGDIGVLKGRSFAAGSLGFGYNQMGGVFAGSFGTGALLDGVSGSVTEITADAIASIAAGKLDTGGVLLRKHLASRVAAIVLNGNTQTRVDARGNFVNYGAANFLGGVVDPTAAGSVTYPAVGPHANTFDLGAAPEYGDNGTASFGLGDTVTAATDGFVAAVAYDGADSSVRPEALVTLTTSLTSLEVGAAISPTETLANLRLATRITRAGSILVNGKTVSYSPTDTLNDFLTRLTGTVGGGFTATYDAAGDVIRLSSGSPITLQAGSASSNLLTAFKLAQNGTNNISSATSLGVVDTTKTLATGGFTGGTGGAGSFRVNGALIAFDPSVDTLNSLLAKINKSAAGVTARYDALQDRIVLEGKSSRTTTSRVYVEETTTALTVNALKLARTLLGATLSFDSVQFIDLNNNNGQN